MTRILKWGCFYKRTTLIACSINIVVALCIFRSVYGPLYIHSNHDRNNVFKYTPVEISKMEESIRIRSENEPLDLVNLLKKFKEELKGEERVVELPVEVKRNISEEILLWLRRLNVNANITEQREAVESWHKEKLQEVRQLIHTRQDHNSSTLREEMGMLKKALESDWSILLENIGLWIPPEINNDEPDEIDEEEDLEHVILPGRPLPPECNAELHADYGGTAVTWGLAHHKESAADCCEACSDQAKQAKPGEKKCNVWVYCPLERGCYSPDIYQHKNQECWLKYAQKPKLNFKNRYSDSYRIMHPNAPKTVPWVSGILSE